MPKPPASKPTVTDEPSELKVEALVSTPKRPVVVNMDAKQFDQWLDRQLRGMFDSVAEEPVPQSLIDLIKNQGEPKG